MRAMLRGMTGGTKDDDTWSDAGDTTDFTDEVADDLRLDAPLADGPLHPFDVVAENRFVDPQTIGKGGIGRVSAVFDPRLGSFVRHG